jgi:DNA-binding response OmpR family regulator
MLDDLEDWVRESIHPDDLAARTRPLAERAVEDPPTIDADGLVRFDGRWAVVPASQVALLQLLIERFDRVVAKQDVVAAYEACGGSGHANSVRSVTVRLSKRLAAIGLDLVTIRGRGFMLTRAGGRR